MFTRTQLSGWIVVAILVTAVVGGGLPLMSAAQDQSGLAKEIRAVIEARNKAFRERDIDALMVFYSDDAVVLGVGEGELWVGKEEIRAAHLEMFKSFDRELMDMKWNKWGHDESNNTAWASYIFEVTSSQGDTSFTFQLNLSTVLVREAEGWRVASIHYSNEVGMSPGEDD